MKCISPFWMLSLKGDSWVPDKYTEVNYIFDTTVNYPKDKKKNQSCLESHTKFL